MPGLFIAGTDTGVGKTTVAAGLIRNLVQRGFTVAGLKPVASGCQPTPEGLRSDDALLLMAESNFELSYEQVNPCAYERSVGPHLAAGGVVPWAAGVAACQRAAAEAEWVVVEGIGGWMVPLDNRSTMADLAVALGYPVVLVVGLRLGCLSHALLTAAAVTGVGLPLAGWVGVELSLDQVMVDELMESLSQRLPGPNLGLIPFMECPDSAAVARALDLSLAKQ